MNRTQSFFLAMLVAVGLAGCDFQAAEDAFNDFDVIIGLEPINTVVNGIVVDNATGELLAAHLEFSGPDASVLIDAYSDPVDEINAEDGVVTFGIQNAVVPSEGSPVTITVTATAEGYYTTVETIEVTEVGDAAFTISMPGESISGPAARGTAATQDSSTQTDGSGAVTQTTTVQTQQTAQTTASATVTVPQGSVPLTANGTPLTGQITTQLRSYDSGSGLQALPSGARRTTGGTNQAVAGAVFFKMADGAGNVAVDARAASSGVVASKSAGVCTGGIKISLKSSDASLRATYDVLVGLGITVDARVYAFTPADGQNNEVAATIVEPDGANGLKVELCIGGAAGSDGLINTTAIGNPDDGIIYTFAFGSSYTTSGLLNHMVTLSGLTGTPGIKFSLAGPGINRSATTYVGNGSYELRTLLGAPGDFTVVNNATYVLTAQYSGSNQSVAVSITNPLSGSSSLSLPSGSDLVNFNVTASMQCADPNTQKFEVQITTQSLDAVSAFYRIAGSGSEWTVLRKAAITSKTATDARIEIKGNVAMRPSTEYRFKGVLGTDASTTLATSPAAAGPWTITLSTDDVGISCVNR